MKRYMFLMFGFEKPTPEIMDAWGKWFESIAGKTVDQGGFHGGAREISDAGTKDLPMGMESITGYTGTVNLSCFLRVWTSRSGWKRPYTGLSCPRDHVFCRGSRLS